MNLMPYPTDADGGWKERLSTVIRFPNGSTVQQFLDTTVCQAMENVKAELEKNHVDAEIISAARKLSLSVQHGTEHSFIYAVKRVKYQQPSFSLDNEESEDDDEEQNYYRAEVHLAEGGQDYDIMGWSKQAVINDIIDQYQKHQHFLHLLR
ncbi:hypothetical protein RS130_18705 [Paraglaciecola aquimarina]|uniref:Uncharacterized protein n=1 Tax=Paraglaciecola aquimarina TaxID=1235557 RepID=A0ABU3T0D9_9ALTE|nr:hypothetical protein [Paraglaciecola aquimarina]MDU0355647.1 hypothetical protein [Paraglaciecola aquimarina]